MKIHRVSETYEDKWEAHPDLGMTKVRRTVMKPSGDHALVHGDKTYPVDDDGSFDVPEEIGRELVKRAGWHEGPSPFAVAEQIAEQQAAEKPKRRISGD